MNKEFEFSSLYYMEEPLLENKIIDEVFFRINDSVSVVNSLNDVIEVFDAENGESPVAYTYAKFLETLDAFGLEGFVTV